MATQNGAPRGKGQNGKPAGEENVFTRKIGPLPMWVWLTIAAAIVIAIVLFMKKKGSSSTAGKNTGGGARYRYRGFGQWLRPRRPPHARHHHRGGGRQDLAETPAAGERARARSTSGPGPGRDRDVGPMDRRDRRGHPVPGELAEFKAAESGQTPSLQDVANQYNTSPDAIIEEAEGRGSPHGPMWSRYVARHDWAAPLPPATQLSILAHPG